MTPPIRGDKVDVYYLSSDRFPWALDIPAAGFNYPCESVNINNAYLKFGAWVNSGGTAYSDWYSNTVQGYRNTENIFP
ncbi:DUF4842 domain-containing protein [Hufsiella ginkgonis]|uniref:DUF4842 domain-containing protein n=1 Tax=Hufsiella ginkgonis TaxID=2695274 RepID=A0A7K1Y317_9SPHI|nr:DUF4842 domain-containing protein [Hufsiella ginkgonis]MXV17076.1 DUF4842 domain-containing protein [Hufsiella ginkgonis]